MVQIVYHTLPVPAVLEHTVQVPAGAVTFGVEYRHLDEATVLAHFGPDAEAKFNGGVRPAGMGEVVAEDGLAIHVFDAATGEERLRFDCFDDAPHFHLLDPGPPRNVVVEHDPAAGPLLDQTLAWLRSDLPTLLGRAGATDLAARIDPDAVSIASDMVGQISTYVLAAGRPVQVRGPGGIADGTLAGPEAT